MFTGTCLLGLPHHYFADTCLDKWTASAWATFCHHMSKYCLQAANCPVCSPLCLFYIISLNRKYIGNSYQLIQSIKIESTVRFLMQIWSDTDNSCMTFFISNFYLDKYWSQGNVNKKWDSMSLGRGQSSLRYHKWLIDYFELKSFKK